MNLIRKLRLAKKFLSVDMNANVLDNTKRKLWPHYHEQRPNDCTNLVSQPGDRPVPPGGRVEKVLLRYAALRDESNEKLDALIRATAVS